MKQTNFLVEIFVKTSLTESVTDYGFYVDSFKWILVDQSGYIAKSGILLKDWCPNFSRRIDIRRSGNYTSIGGGTLKLDNTTGLFNFIYANNLSLKGCVIKISDVGITDGKKTIYSGVTTNFTYSQSEINLSFEDFSKFRNQLISQEIEYGSSQYFPAIYGTLDKAKYIANENVQPIFLKTVEDDSVDFVCRIEEIITTPALFEIASSVYFKLKPFTDGGVSEEQRVLIAEFNNLSDTKGAIYAECVKGSSAECVKGSSKGLIVKIVDLRFDGDDYDYIYSELAQQIRVNEDGSHEPLPFNEKNDDDHPESDVGYVRFFYLAYENYIDKYSSVGGLQDNNKLYCLQDDNYNYFSVNDEVKILTNKLEINPTNLDSIDTLKCFVKAQAKPSIYGWTSPSTISVFHDHDFIDPFYAVPGSGSDGEYRYFYKVTDPCPANTFTHGDIGNGDIYDGDHNNGKYYNFEFQPESMGSTKTWELAIPFSLHFEKLPYFDLSKLVMTYDIRALVDNTGSFNNRHLVGSKLLLITSSYWSDSIKHHEIPFDSDIEDSTNTARGHLINNCLNLLNYRDIAYPNELRNNGNFYRHNTLHNPNYVTLLSMPPPVGYEDYYVSHVNGHDYNNNSIEFSLVDLSDIVTTSKTLDFEALIILKFELTGGQTTAVNERLEILNVQLLAETSFSITEDGIYGKWYGRKDHNDDIITNAITMYNHICKLQNYTQSSATEPTAGWGQEPLSFDHLYDLYDLVDEDNYFATRDKLSYDTGAYKQEYACELLTKDELMTENIKLDLLRSTWCFGTQNFEGAEQIFSLMHVFDNDVDREQIAYTDIIPGSLSNISEPKKEDIFCEPSLKYGYDYGLEKYLCEIKITNTHKSTFDITYVIDTGNELTASEKENLWTMGHQLFERYQIVNEAPQNLRESKWIKKRYNQSQYMSAAYTYLYNWLKWQGANISATDRFSEKREISFEIPYEVAINKGIKEGSLIQIEIPFIDNLNLGDILGVVTGVNYNLSMGREKVKVTALIKIDTLNDVTLIIETGSASIDIVESGSQMNEVDED